MTLSGGGTVTTNGAEAPGVVATGTGSMVTLSGTSLLTVTTITDNSIGLLAQRGVIDATAPVTIFDRVYRGDTKRGQCVWQREQQLEWLAARRHDNDGVGANGLDAYGLYASNGGPIDGSLAPSVVTTFGTGADGVYAAGTSSTTPTTASTIKIAGATIITNGTTATGVLADLGGQVA